MLLASAGFLLLVGAYNLIVSLSAHIPTGLLYTQLSEVLLLGYLYILCWLLLRPSRLRAWLAALPLMLLYVIHDTFYMVYAKVFRLINVSELPELLQVLPVFYSAALVLLVAAPLIWFALHVRLPRLRTILHGLLPLLLLILSIEFIPQAFATAFTALGNEVIKYSDSKNVESNGRLSMMLFRESQRSAALEQLHPYYDRLVYEQDIARQITALQAANTRRNVHLIVLESFLDPRLFQGLAFDRSPVHPDFEKLFGKQLGLSRSPVFGGATAQAEFEVLCGVPAFEKVSSVEFNAFNGAAAHCLPDWLQQMGYRSVASNAYKPNFFNAQPGYQGSGFGEVYFPREYSGSQTTYLSVAAAGSEDYLFDGDLFLQNLGMVREHLQKKQDTPLFNYMMTIYGHTPHLLDPSQRPERIHIRARHGDDHLQRAANQFYYRSEAIARYINELLALDKNSLIILLSDHVPPLRYGPDTYRALAYLDNRQDSIYLNRIAIIENGKVKTYDPMSHYEVPAIILDYVSAGRFCESHRCPHRNPGTRREREQYLDDYMRLMAHAAE